MSVCVCVCVQAAPRYVRTTLRSSPTENYRTAAYPHATQVVLNKKRATRCPDSNIPTLRAVLNHPIGNKHFRREKIYGSTGFHRLQRANSE